MLLMKVVQDDTMAVPGFEHHTLMCSACYDVERRLVFARPDAPSPAEVAPSPAEVEPSPAEAGPGPAEAEPSPAEQVPVHPAPPISPASPPASERIEAPGVWARALARFRGRSL
jgi:hypothetical protein